MKCIIVSLMIVLVSTLTSSAPSPGLLYAALPAPSSDTRIVRDGLGNQATSYAYQDGHSSAVSLSRSDVSKHLVAVPAPAPVVYHQAIPAYHHTYAAAALPAYHHQTYAAAAPAFHGYAGYAAPAYYY